METKNNFLLILISIISLISCKKETVDPFLEDCNGIVNGTSLLDDCDVCQQAYLYNTITHEVDFVNDTNGISIGGDEVLVLPNNSISPYWNSSCSYTDCNQVLNGTSLMDSCGVCQQAYVYNTITHETNFINDTTDISLDGGEVIILPDNPQNPYWNNACLSISGTINELNASDYIVNPICGTLSGEFIKFSFESADTLSNHDWDIAFRGTSIIVNGGEASDASQPERTGNAAVYIIDGAFDDITSVDTNLLVQDNSDATAIIDDFGFTGLGWCSYNQISHVISPIPGKVLVFRTHDNKYAKIEILNFYHSEITNPYGGYYTFNYVYLQGGQLDF